MQTSFEELFERSTMVTFICVDCWIEKKVHFQKPFEAGASAAKKNPNIIEFWRDSSRVCIKQVISKSSSCGGKNTSYTPVAAKVLLPQSRENQNHLRTVRCICCTAEGIADCIFTHFVKHLGLQSLEGCFLQGLSIVVAFKMCLLWTQQRPV